MNIEVFSYYSAWVVNSIYFLGFIPQIMLNYRLKTTKGLSSLMLFIYTVGYITYWYHVVFSDNNFPMSYQVMTPIVFFALLFIITQGFYYNGVEANRKFLYSYVAVFTVTLFLLPVSLQYSNIVAKICGWIYFVISFIYVIPQGIKIYKEKSIRGLSFTFITIFVLGVLLEFIVALVLGLSKPIIFNAIRGLLVYVIFCIFFYKYKK